MTSEKDAFFWLCQFFHPSALCHRAWFHYIKDTCVKSCTPRLIDFFCTAVLLSLTVHSCNYLKCAWRMKAAFPGPVLWRYMGISVKSCDFFPKVQRWKLFSKMFLTDSQSVDIRRKDALSTRALLNSFQNVKSNQTVLFYVLSNWRNRCFQELFSCQNILEIKWNVTG